ncbi:hypothetical protein LO772_07190 [Yinghuangia sp. ASG 101]|uniref:hypothetical protein n=1 Tax=Yinghuangia sp. ASG 101 TaxID=2896848 RepID=UPI001E2C1B45|nr:hypothetical protein [Yinghuangia sp. ASG 101]UGQ13385.1 hypothetical protein LO772_07190 [Yinghuangia sp. ASG 101]
MGEFDIVVTGPAPVLDQLCALLRVNGRLVRAEPVRAAEEPHAHGSFVVRVSAPGAVGGDAAGVDGVGTGDAAGGGDGAGDAGAAASGERAGVLGGLFRPGARHRVTRGGGRHRAPRDTRPPSTTRRSAPGTGRRAARGGDAGLPQWLPVVDSVAWPPFFTETALPPPVAAGSLRLPTVPWPVRRRRSAHRAAADTAPDAAASADAAEPYIPGPRTVDNHQDEHDHAADRPTAHADRHPADHVTDRPAHDATGRPADLTSVRIGDHPAESPAHHAVAPPREPVPPEGASPAAVPMEGAVPEGCPPGYETTGEHEALDRLYAAIGSLRALARTYRGATLEQALVRHGLRPASLGLTAGDVAYFDALIATNPGRPDAATEHVRRLRGPAPSPDDAEPASDPRADPLAQRRTDTGAHRRPRRRRDGGPR